MRRTDKRDYLAAPQHVRFIGDKYVKTFENATSLLLAVAAQALAIGVVLAI